MAKPTKSIVLVYMYDLLISEGSYTREKIMKIFDLPELTFHRYTGELREYVNRYKPGYELHYSKRTGQYQFLKKK